MPNPKTIRLLIADDHEVVRTGLRSLLADTEVDIVADVANAEDAVTITLREVPDVVLLDIRMEQTNGLTALERIKRELPEMPVLILSTYDNPTYVSRAVALGASGYLLKGASREELLTAIRTAAAGEKNWSQEDLRRVMGAMHTPRVQADLDVPLTQREADVLQLVASGKTNKEIARTLSISVETVKEHVQHILRKIGVADRTQAAVWAVRAGLV